VASAQVVRAMHRAVLLVMRRSSLRLRSLRGTGNGRQSQQLPFSKSWRSNSSRSSKSRPLACHVSRLTCWTLITSWPSFSVTVYRAFEVNRDGVIVRLL
jgi:hypothetical protein